MSGETSAAEVMSTREPELIEEAKAAFLVEDLSRLSRSTRTARPVQVGLSQVQRAENEVVKDRGQRLVRNRFDDGSE